MKRTSSGSDLSHQTLLGAATPYVYMAAQTSNLSASSPLKLAKDIDDPSVFRRHCGGGTLRRLHSSDAAAYALPSGFDVVIADGFLNGLQGFTREPLFSVPLNSIARAQSLHAGGANMGIWTLLCSCCFGARQKVLALDLDAPAGWIQWEALAGRGIAGPVRLGLYVLDAEEWTDAMGLALG